MKAKRHTVTAALPYTNGPVHIGHLAGVYIPADIYARYLRLKREDVIFVCGSDEHGIPITIKAKQEGVTPQEVVDKYHKIIGDSFKEFGISFDIYSRTSSKIHHKTASDFFRTLYEKGEFTEQVTLQYYDEEQKQFLADRYIEGTCPKCGDEHAYGDQCEKCGSSLSPTELINPKSKLSGNKPVLKETRHWFLPLDKYEPWLREWILNGHKNDWKINVYGQCKSWIDSGDGLQPRAMTRDLDWGVPVPVEGAEGKVLYVWFDAPIGYISATRELLPDDWEKYWKDKETKLVHFIGKDNIVFHCIIFPAILKAHGGYILPDNVPANEFLNLEGEKISTSRNWAVWLPEYLKDFPNKQDELRYVLTSIAPETKDSDFSWKDYQARVNNELVAILGNFVNRVAVLSDKYFNGKFDSTYFAPKLQVEITKSYEKFSKNIESYQFREALNVLMNLARSGNQYLQENEPWKKFNSENINAPENIFVKEVLSSCCELIAHIAVLCDPLLPSTSKKLLSSLNLDIKNIKIPSAFEKMLTSNFTIKMTELLFPKIEDAAIEAQLEKLRQSKITNEAQNKAGVTPKPETSFDDFLKMDIRVGTILEAEKVPKTQKLLKLLIDTGIDKRTVVSGIAEYYNPSDIIGQKVSILVNLAPRKIKGIDSQGMILMAGNDNGKLAFVTPSKEMENGSLIS